MVGLSFFARSQTGSAPQRNALATGDYLVHWTMALYLCIAGTLLSVLGMTVWGMDHDLDQVRATLIDSEMDRLRSHASRTVIRIQDECRRLNATLDDRFRRDGYLRRHWNRVVKNDESRLYSAIVDPTGKVFMHTDPTREGGHLETVWYDRTIPEGGDDVVDTRAEALTGGDRALDVRVPILVDGRPAGSYHTGLSQAWLERKLKDRELSIKWVWGWLLGGILVSVLVSGMVLIQIGRRITLAREAAKMVQERRFAELGQLTAGIVHEIRNPLNAVRLNLHVLGRKQECAKASHDSAADESLAVDRGQIIRETNQEIERVEGLMRILLGYARPDQHQPQDLDIRRELEATLGLLKQVLERSEVAVCARFTEFPVFVHMDRDRLRQIIINLLNNARDATGPGGHIQICVHSLRDAVEIVVADDGPGVPPSDRERIFEPFFSTKNTGTGLGLALVRRYVEEAGGTVTCEPNDPRGARFCLRFPKGTDGWVNLGCNHQPSTY